MIKLKDILSEIIKEHEKISKVEENEALQFIRRDIIPIVVDYVNVRTVSHEISVNDVTKNLKKINPEYTRTRGIAHCILFHSDVPKKTGEEPLRIKFIITKRFSGGDISVAWGLGSGWSGSYPLGFIG